MAIKIIGETNVYEKIKSEYVITLNSKKEAIAHHYERYKRTACRHKHRALPPLIHDKP